MEKEIDTKAEMASLLKQRSQQIRANIAGIDPIIWARKNRSSVSGCRPLERQQTGSRKMLGSPGDYQAITKQAIAMAFEQVRQLSARPAVQEVLFAMKSNPISRCNRKDFVKIMNAVDGLANYQIAMQFR